MAKRVAYYANLLALALILSWLENLVPIQMGIPGIKLGLTNIVPVFLLYRNGWGPALALNISRILLANLLFGNVMGLFYALTGGILSTLAMAGLKRLPFLTAVGVSAAGGVVHNIGQWLAALLFMPITGLLYYLPFLLLSGVIAGFLVGFVARLLIPLPDRIHMRN